MKTGIVAVFGMVITFMIAYWIIEMEMEEPSKVGISTEMSPAVYEQIDSMLATLIIREPNSPESTRRVMREILDPTNGLSAIEQVLVMRLMLPTLEVNAIIDGPQMETFHNEVVADLVELRSLIAGDDARDDILTWIDGTAICKWNFTQEELGLQVDEISLCNITRVIAPKF